MLLLGVGTWTALGPFASRPSDGPRGVGGGVASASAATAGEAPPPPAAASPPPTLARTTAPVPAGAAGEEPGSGPPARPSEVHAIVLDVASEKPVAVPRVTASWTEGRMEEGAMRTARKTVSAEPGAEGVARLVFADRTVPGLLDFSVEGTWHAVRWHREGSPTDQTLRTAPGDVTRMVVWVRAAFRLRGTVVDGEGRPIEGAIVVYAVPRQGPERGILIGSITDHTRADGAFDVGPFAEDPASGFGANGQQIAPMTSRVVVTKTGFATSVVDVREVAAAERDRLVVAMGAGATLAGTLVDPAGRPVPDAAVVVEFGDVYELRRGTRTDAEGKWRLERLARGSAALVARDFSRDLKVRQARTIAGDDLDVRLVAEEIRLARPPTVVRALGLGLCDVDDAVRAAYDVPPNVHVMVFDPGDDSERLGIGRLEKGYGLWIVGEEPASSVRDALERLLLEPKTQNDSLPGKKRVVYTFWNEGFTGTNTQYLNLPSDDRDAVRAALDRLPR